MILYYLIIEKDLISFQNFENIEKLVQHADLDDTSWIIDESISKIKEQKIIRIADKYDWDVAREYKDDPTTGNSEDSQRVQQAEGQTQVVWF